MNPNLHDIDLIQRYLDRSLNDTEKKNLEERLRHEPALKSMYLEHQQLIKGIRFSYLQQRLQQLRTLEGVLPVIQPEAKKGKQIWLAVYWKQAVAVAASLLICAVTYVVWNQSASAENLYAEYFTPYPNVIEPIVRNGNETVTKRTKAFSAYEAGNYEMAATLFTELLNEKEEPGILLLLGNANLTLGRTADARSNFVKLINDYSDYDNIGKWYLALSYLKDGDVKTAQVLLQEVSNSEYSYAARAKKMLNKLE
ncbi:hypothetical protein QQ054_25475 [Oscillatoria amoena NRMC-F 0135]|nr:hypothetical protein [Oscillatoria amoena NRMC-F 0135]